MAAVKVTKKLVLNSNLTKPANQIFYGTAGYRLKTPDLNNVVCRASIISYIRSATFAGKFIGLYITASHNPIDYNGVSFIDFNGNMLDEPWEIASDELVNCGDQDFNAIINKIFRQNSNYNNMNDSIRGNVIIGRDTRETGIMLSKNVEEVLNSYRCNVYDYGVVSCPEMHFLIRKCNEINGKADKGLYIKHVLNTSIDLTRATSRGMFYGIDTANGVGKYKIEALQALNPRCDFEILNDMNNTILNHDCGAEFIKTTHIIPKLKSTGASICASFDGDVDRLILFTPDGKVFDGDSQCVFIAELIKSELIKEKLSYEIGIVLSYYSNSGAVDYLRSKGFPVQLALTGVKNFVRASRKFEIGVYYEPNGHGSVSFSKRFVEKMDERSDSSVLKILMRMFDPCVGDALANLLVFKATLQSISELSKYNENYSRLLSVKVHDKNLIKVDQNYLVLESTIQTRINEQVLLYKGRAFVRPSGTEEVIKVFAECANETHCDKLALNVAQIIYDNCKGEGSHPEIKYHI